MSEDSLNEVVGNQLPIVLDEHLQSPASVRKQPGQCEGSAVLLELGLYDLRRKGLSAKY